MTPSKESLDRAKAWRLANTEIIERVNGSSYLKWNRSPEEFDSDIALEFERVRLEAQIEILQANTCENPDSIVIYGRELEWQIKRLRAQLAALNQPAGEKEGHDES